MPLFMIFTLTIFLYSDIWLKEFVPKILGAIQNFGYNNDKLGCLGCSWMFPPMALALVVTQSQPYRSAS